MYLDCYIIQVYKCIIGIMMILMANILMNGNYIYWLLILPLYHSYNSI